MILEYVKQMTENNSKMNIFIIDKERTNKVQ